MRLYRPGDSVWVRATVRDHFPGEVYTHLRFEAPRQIQSICVADGDVKPELTRAQRLRRDSAIVIAAVLIGAVIGTLLARA